MMTKGYTPARPFLLDQSGNTAVEYPSLVKIGNTYLKLYGECLDALLNSAQSDAVKLDRADIEAIQ
jgi:Flp pilus assembly pilin Flp